MANPQVERLLSDVLNKTGIMGGNSNTPASANGFRNLTPEVGQPIVDTTPPVLSPRVEQAPPPPPEDGYLETIGKGMVQGVEGMMGGVGSTVRWGGEVIGSEGIAEAGKTAEKYWQDAAQNGFAGFEGESFQGSFMENPSAKRAFGIIGQAVPSLVAAYATGGAASGMLARLGLSAAKATTGGAVAAAGGLGLLEGAPQATEALDAGKSVGQASAVGVASTVGSAVLEFLPIGRLLKVFKNKELVKLAKQARTGAITEAGKKTLLAKVNGSYIKNMAKEGAVSALEEGAQEGAQNTFQNMVAILGYDETRKLTEGLVESIIGGMGAGGVMGSAGGMVTARQNQQLRDALNRAKVPEKDRAEIREEYNDAAVELYNQVQASQ